jgi:hypothetical protein
MAEIYFNGGDGAIKLKKLTINQSKDFMSYEIETENGVTYQSPLFMAVLK